MTKHGGVSTRPYIRFPVRVRPGCAGSRRGPRSPRPFQLFLFDDPRGRVTLVTSKGISLDYLADAPGAWRVSMGVHESQSRTYENQLGAKPCLSQGGSTSRCAASSGISVLPIPRPSMPRSTACRPAISARNRTRWTTTCTYLLRFDLERALIAGRPGGLRSWKTPGMKDFSKTSVSKLTRSREWCPARRSLVRGAVRILPDLYFGQCLCRDVCMPSLRRDVPDLDSALAAGRHQACDGLAGRKGASARGV